MTIVSAKRPAIVSSSWYMLTRRDAFQFMKDCLQSILILKHGFFGLYLFGCSLVCAVLLGAWSLMIPYLDCVPKPSRRRCIVLPETQWLRLYQMPLGLERIHAHRKRALLLFVTVAAVVKALYYSPLSSFVRERHLPRDYCAKTQFFLLSPVCVHFSASSIPKENILTEFQSPVRIGSINTLTMFRTINDYTNECLEQSGGT